MIFYYVAYIIVLKLVPVVDEPFKIEEIEPTYGGRETFLTTWSVDCATNRS